MKVYLDTSVVLAYFLDGNDAISRIPQDAQVGSSRLLWIEFSRVLERAIRTGALGAEEAVRIRRGFDEMANTIARIRLTEGILRRAEGSFPLVIRSLDALHISSALVWFESDDSSDNEIWTLDRQFNLCAAAMGLRTPLFVG